MNPKAWGKLNSQELHIDILHNAAKTYLNTINETLAYKCCGPVSSLDHSWLQWVHFDRCIHMWTLPEPDWAHREPEGQSPALLEDIKKWKIVFCQGFFFFFRFMKYCAESWSPKDETLRLAFSQEEKQIPLMLFQEGHPVFGTTHCGDPLRIREQLKLAHLYRHLMDCHEIWVRCSSSPEDEI